MNYGRREIIRGTCRSKVMRSSPRRSLGPTWIRTESRATPRASPIANAARSVSHDRQMLIQMHTRFRRGRRSSFRIRSAAFSENDGNLTTPRDTARVKPRKARPIARRNVIERQYYTYSYELHETRVLNQSCLLYVISFRNLNRSWQFVR